MSITYKELGEEIQRMTPRQQGTNVTIYDPLTDEYIAPADINYSGEDNDVLDMDHPIIELPCEESQKNNRPLGAMENIANEIFKIHKKVNVLYDQRRLNLNERQELEEDFRRDGNYNDQ